MIDIEKDIDEDELEKYKKKNIFIPLIMLILVLCALGYILFGPGGILSYLPQNVGEVLTDKQIEEMKKQNEKETEEYNKKQIEENLKNNN